MSTSHGVPAFEKLLEPGQIGGLKLSNRIIMSPMGSRLSNVWGEVTDDIVEWYVTRARGGAAMIIVEVAHAASATDPATITPGLRADDDCYGPGLARLAEAIHDAGAKAGIQLTAGFGAQAFGTSAFAPNWTPGQRWIEEVPPVGPSAVPSPLSQKRPRALTIEEIEKIVDLCGRAAQRVKQAGFDLIDIAGHQGYLIAEFLSPYFNKRLDRYGGASLEGRLRFLLEIIATMRNRVGRDFPLTVKYSLDEYIAGGLGIEEGVLIARRLEEARVDALNVACGIYGARQETTAPMYFPEGYMVGLAEAVKKVVKIPVIVSGRLGDPSLAESVLLEGKSDFIAMGRPLIADPDLPTKVAEGRTDEIRRCTACNFCRENMAKGGPVRCAVNASAGRERRYRTITPAERRKRVVVIGAGPGGMEAARVAALKGHSVVLCDRDAELGGLLKVAAAPPHKDVFQNIVNYYQVAFSRLPNVELRLGQEATVDWILSLEPDAVIVACGAVESFPLIPGAPAHRVVNAFDVLSGRATVGDRVVVNRGGLFGCETANFLARQGKKVAVVESGDVGATDMELWSWMALSEELNEAGVEMLTRSTIDKVVSEGVLAVTVVSADGSQRVLLADRLVVVPELSPNDRLAMELRGKVKEIYTVGDAKKPGRIYNAIPDGFVAAYAI